MPLVNEASNAGRIQRHDWFPKAQRGPRAQAQNRPVSSHDAAKESNLPSRGLPGPASFEDWQERLEISRGYWRCGLEGMGKGMTGHASPTCTADSCFAR